MPISVEELLRTKRDEMLTIASRYAARNVRIFGSATRGEAGTTSDIDFLDELEEGRSLLDLVGLWQDLETLLGRRVGVFEPEGVHWYIGDKVLKETVSL